MLERGNRIWLFRDGDGGLIGYGALGTTHWRWPPPDGDYANLMIIPMLGVDQRHQGMPPGDPALRYSRRMLEHLIGEAEEWNATLKRSADLLVLMVREVNHRARRLYFNVGFRVIDGERRGKNQDHLLMARRLRRL